MVFILSIVIIILDQFTKKMAVKYLMEGGPISVIGDFFKLYYVENAGAAFGILQNRKIFFIAITSIAVIGILGYAYFHYDQLGLGMKLSLAMILGGAVGNFIDRFRFGYVVDFLSFNIFGYDFPVFNVADVFIVIGTGLMMILVLTEE